MNTLSVQSPLPYVLAVPSMMVSMVKTMAKPLSYRFVVAGLLTLCFANGAFAQVSSLFEDKGARIFMLNLQDQLTKLTKQIAAAEAARQERDAPLEKALQEARAQLQALTQAQAQIQAQADERLRLQEGELAQQKQELNRATSAQAQQLLRVIENLNNEFDKVRKDIDQVRGDNSELARLVSRGGSAVEKLEGLQVGLQSSIGNLRLELAELKKRSTDFETANKSVEETNKSGLVGLQTAISAVTAGIDSLRGDLKGLQTRMDSLQTRMDGMQTRMDNMQAGLDGVEKNVKSVGSEVDAQKRKIEPETVTVDGLQFQAPPGEAKAYNDAVDAFKRKEYEKSRTALQRFLTSYSTPGFRGSANYYLGMAHFYLAEYKAALESFRRVGDDHPLAPEVLLYEALSQDGLKDSAAARSTLQRLYSKFPKSDAAGQARDFQSRGLLPRFR